MPDISFNHQFNFLAEKKDHLIARLYRSTLKEKLYDVLFFFSGTGEYIGLFDYVTLFVPRLVWKGTFNFVNHAPHHLIIDLAILVIPNLFLNYIPRAIFSVIGVLITLPVILFVHAWSIFQSQKTKQEAFQVKMQRCEDVDTETQRLYRQHNNRQSMNTETPVRMFAELQLLDDVLKLTNYTTLENYSAEPPRVRNLNNQSIWSILLFKQGTYRDCPVAIIPVASPHAANCVTQLAKINFAHIGEHIDEGQEVKAYVSQMRRGLISWNKQATESGYICMLLLQLKASNKLLPFDMVHLIATYLIPDTIQVADKYTGYMHPLSKATFFLMNRASEISQSISRTRSQQTPESKLTMF